jgi:hypothetical protein
MRLELTVRINTIILKTCALSALGLMSVQGNAATVSTELTGNDCPGVFTGSTPGFNGCVIAIDGVELSPVIAKVEVDDFGDVTMYEINDTLYPSIDGSEFTISYDTDTSSGSWTYDGTAPDPNVKFWAAKAGPNFNLFWNVDDSETMAGGACETTTFNLACMQAAQNAFSGSWSTPGGKNLSHITFYNSGIVPIPAAVWLFGSGLLGLVAVARRRRA